jgi:FkbM family methyltransferase
VPRIPERFTIVARWLADRVRMRTTPASASEMLRFAASPSWRARGRRYVRRVERDGEMLVVHFHGMERPLYWPAEYPLDGALLVAGEQFNPRDWHYYEVPETAVRADDVVVDCGAAEGLFSLRVAPRCRHVYAVEPLPRFVESMRLTLAAQPNVEIVPCLLGARAGTARIAGEGLTAAVGEIGPEVPVRTADELFLARDHRPSYLKADVEGAELDLLAGARELIHAEAPRIAITTYHDPSHADAITRLLRGVRPDYRVRVKGFTSSGAPIMLHAWT